MSGLDYVYLWATRKEWRRDNHLNGAYVTIVGGRPFGMHAWVTDFTVVSSPNAVDFRKKWAVRYWVRRLSG